MYEFSVAIGYGREPGQFRVQVLDSPGGAAYADVKLDVEALLAQRDPVMKAVILSGLAAARYNPAAGEVMIRTVGEPLFTALLGTDPVLSCYRSSQDSAARDEASLRIVLRSDVPELAALPWEAMYDAQRGGYVCRHHPLVRRVAAAATPPLAVPPPLRILGIVSAPRDQPPLDADREREQLTQALAGPVGSGLIELAWAGSATWAAIQEQLRTGPWHVIHFIGHGDFEPVRGEGRLALTQKDGLADWVEANRLADLVRQAQPVPRAVVLNSCQGAEASAGDLFSATATTLARNGVAAVAAMRYPISNRAAIHFAEGFYGMLADCRGVDEAVMAGRTAILGLSGNSLEWVTPVLCLGNSDTRLFEMAGHPAPAGELPPPAVAAPARPALPAAPRPRLLHELVGHTGPVHQAVLSRDGTLLATASADQTIRLWDVTSGGRRAVLTFGEDKKRISERLWPSRRRGKKPASGSSRLLPGTLGVPEVLLSRRGVLVGRCGPALRIWTIGAEVSPVQCDLRDRPAGTLAFNNAGTQLAVTSLDESKVELWNALTWELVSSWPRSGAPVQLAYSPDGAWLIGLGTAGRLALWDCVAGTEQYGGVAPFGALELSAKEVEAGYFLLTAEYHRPWDHVATWNEAPASATGRKPARGKVRLFARQVAFSPDGSLFATRNVGNVELYKTSTWRLIGRLRGNWDHMTFSPTSSVIALTGSGRSTVLWRTEPWADGVTLDESASTANPPAFSEDGRLLATASQDNAVRLWDTETCQCVATLPGHSAVVHSLSFSLDGSTLVTASRDTTVRLWKL